MPISITMKSAFLILLFLPLSLLSETITIANQSGRIKSVNVVHNMNYKYSDFEYTSACILSEYKYESNAITFDGKSLKAVPKQNNLTYQVANQTIYITMGMPALTISNRLCIPINDYFNALDSLGICKILSRTDNIYRISDYSILKTVPKISTFSNKYTLAYFKQVYNEVNEKQKPVVKKLIKKKQTEDKTLELIKDALEDEKSELPKSSEKKDDYYDIPRGLNKEEALKKKKH